MHLHLQWKINLAFLPFPADTVVMFLAICCFRHSLQFAFFSPLFSFHCILHVCYLVDCTKLAPFSTLLFPLPKYLSACILLRISYFQMTCQKWILSKKPFCRFSMTENQTFICNSSFSSAFERSMKAKKFLLAEDIIRQSGSKWGSSGSYGPSLARSSIDVASEQSYFGGWIVSFYSQFIWLCKLCRRAKGRKKVSRLEDISFLRAFLFYSLVAACQWMKTERCS